ncbi:MFS transporter [Cryobacterium arcticum]|uniref:MFS transporter n=1 Tax=Cryobacterium arcticum TaxID=670052 RepID=A0A1B1BKV8_9MICO|nr:MFS transporter [Cryobacterium arcticum]ANP73171.1 MFS transporter [Cryobacterium arcticum]
MTPTPSAVRHKGAILTIILVSYFMILLDNSVIFTALPSLESDLGLSSAELAWVQDAYTLVFGGFLLLGARAGDILGRRRVFVVGLVVFAVASLLISVAPTGWWVIAARALQGIGAAVVAPSALSLLTASFEGRERSRAVAWYAATAGIGASAGMLIGGAAASWFSWRAGFIINVPIGLAMILLAPRFLPETPKAPGRFDVTGAVTSTLGVGALVFALLHGAEAGWAAALTIVSGLLAVVLLVTFVIAESRAAQPIMPLRLFRSWERSGAYLVRLLYLGAMIGFFFFTTQYLQGVLGFTPLQAGMAFLPMTLVNFAVALAIPRLVDRLGNVWPLLAGLLLTLGGMIWLAQLGPATAYVSGIAFPMVLIGAGQGLAFAPMTSMGIAGAAPSDAGAASGIVNTFHQVGMSLGLGILVAVATRAGTTGSGEASDPLEQQVSAALTAGSALLALAVLVAVVASVADHRSAHCGASAAPPRAAVALDSNEIPALANEH